MTRRLLWLGLDGGDASTIGTLLAQGRMPTIASLIGNTLYPLPSTIFPITPGAWTAAYTGMNPGKTGILTWQQLDRHYRSSVVNARNIGGRGLFTRIGDAGKTFVSLGFPMSAPLVDRSKGLVVTGWDAPPGSPPCNDSDWAKRLETFGYRTADEFDPDEHVLSENIRAHFRVARALTDEMHWDCLGIYFAFIDTLGHKLGAGNERTLNLLRVVDEELGAFVQDLSFTPEFLVNSDHGFGSFARSFSLIQWLAQRGFLKLRDRFVPDRTSQRGLEFMDVQQSAIDWNETRAFCVDAIGSFAGIHLNLRGTYEQGIVDPRDAWAVSQEIQTALSNEPLVHRAWRREEFAWGSELQRLPELIVQMNDDTVALVGKRRRVSGGYEIEDGYVHDQPFSSHRPDGIWGSSFATSNDPRIEDVAPTIYAVLGMEIPDDVDGVNRSPFHATTQHGSMEDTVQQPSFTPEEEQLVRARLEALGYLE